MPSWLRRRSTKRAASSMASACSWHERAVRGAVDHHEGHDTAPSCRRVDGQPETARRQRRHRPSDTWAFSPSRARAGPPMADARRPAPRRSRLAGHAGDRRRGRARASPTRSPSVRATAIGALERLGALDGGRPRRPRSPTRAPRCGVAPSRPCAGRPGDEPPSLLGALDDDDPTIVEVAAWASGERQPPEAGRGRRARPAGRRPRRRAGPRGRRRRAGRHRRRGRPRRRSSPPSRTRPPCGGGRCSPWRRSRVPTSTPRWPPPARTATGRCGRRPRTSAADDLGAAPVAAARSTPPG